MASREKGWLAFLALSAALVAPPARARGPEGAIRTDLRAPASCPAFPSFFERIHARTPNVTRALGQEESTSFLVVVTHAGDRFVGELTIVDGGDASRPRRVSAAACEDVLSALALIAALSIDPDAAAEEEPGPGSASVAGSASASVAGSGAAPASASVAAPGAASASVAAPGAASASVAAPGAASASVAAPGAASASAPAAAPDEAPAPTPQSARPSASPSPPPRWSLAASLDALSLSSSPVPRAALELRRTWPRGPSVSLSLSVADAYGSVPAGGARLLWTAATLEACPLRWSLSSIVSLSPCVPLEAGLLAVRGADVPAPTVAFRPWLTLGALARIDVALGDRFFVEGRGGVAFPLVHDTFYFLPSTDVYQAPGAVGWGGIAVGFVFR